MLDGEGGAATTRERNMAQRRARILREARRVIAEQGYDALSTRSLARAAGVSQPTLYNLIGSKDEIVKAMIMETAERIIGRLQEISFDDPVAWTDAATTLAKEIFQDDESFYRAAIIASDRNLDLFAEASEDGAPPLIGAHAAALYGEMCGSLIERGALRGQVDAPFLVTALYGVLRVNLRDWAYDMISLDEFVRKMRSAHYLIFAADASPELRRRLLDRHEATLGGGS